MEKSTEDLLGKFARDKITGFEGVVITVAKHVTGCDTVYLRPKAINGNELKDGATFDVGRVEVVDDSAKAVKAEDVADPNGKGGAEDLSTYQRG